jgi:hypothetical protein
MNDFRPCSEFFRWWWESLVNKRWMGEYSFPQCLRCPRLIYVYATFTLNASYVFDECSECLRSAVGVYEICCHTVCWISRHESMHISTTYSVLDGFVPDELLRHPSWKFLSSVIRNLQYICRVLDERSKVSNKHL